MRVNDARTLSLGAAKQVFRLARVRRGHLVSRLEAARCPRTRFAPRRTGRASVSLPLEARPPRLQHQESVARNTRSPDADPGPFRGDRGDRPWQTEAERDWDDRLGSFRLEAA
jgi:hypothetical protein